MKRSSSTNGAQNSSSSSASPRSSRRPLRASSTGAKWRGSSPAAAHPNLHSTSSASGFRETPPSAASLIRALAQPVTDNPGVVDSRTRVALADDDVLLREGLASLLERSGFDVVGQAGDGSTLEELVREHRPDLVVVDIRMPPNHATEGLDAARAIREDF